RAKFASSPAEEFIHGRFEEILGAPEAGPADNVKRIIFCSGKVYYDLLKYRTERKIDDAAIIRIEQLYPLTEKRLREILKPFPKAPSSSGVRKNRKTWAHGPSSNRDCAPLSAPKSRTLAAKRVLAPLS